MNSLVIGSLAFNLYLVGRKSLSCCLWRCGHEVTRPVAVEGAEIGDAIVIRIQDITVTSLATASGNGNFMYGRFVGDPYVAGKCPQCGTLYPATHLDGIGQTAVRCNNCGADVTPFNFTNGYIIFFDPNHLVGVTLPREAAETIARNAKAYTKLPDNSIQIPILAFSPHDLVGLVARLRPYPSSEVVQISMLPQKTV